MNNIAIVHAGRRDDIEPGQYALIRSAGLQLTNARRKDLRKEREYYEKGGMNKSLLPFLYKCGENKESGTVKAEYLILPDQYLLDVFPSFAKQTRTKSAALFNSIVVPMQLA